MFLKGRSHHCQGTFLDASLSSSSSTVGVGAGVRLGVERQDGCRGRVAVEDDTAMFLDNPDSPSSLMTLGWSNSFMQAASRRKSSISERVQMATGDETIIYMMKGFIVVIAEYFPCLLTLHRLHSNFESSVLLSQQPLHHRAKLA
ncbi:hypothetical protein EYF80_023121 [Liparis tanakae]|uniref:Uncharacterized protein n=1 Tax=Liparis tanakae TaxID=230148 RepID=A0A4Z2HLG4_9TELE|nr:hypothetical protein EYF80_023121 [Liparis tanakae]